MTEYSLNVENEIRYAQKWAFSRNPIYYDFENIGGDCTNFISQCLFAGGAAMNYTYDTGWYYSSVNNRAAAWSSVEYFYNFIISNKDIGPFGRLVPLSQIRVGDVVQLGTGSKFYHTLLVVNLRNGEPYIAAHTNDAFNRPLSTYIYDNIRCMQIIGTRK